MSDEQNLIWLADFVRSPSRWAALRSATERTTAAGVELNLLPDGTLRDVSAGAVGRLATFIKAVDPVLALGWQLLALQRTDAPFVIQSVVKGVMAVLTGAKGDTQLALAHLRTWDDIARGRIEADDDDFFRASARENVVVSGVPACVELLEFGRWDDAFSWLSKERVMRAGHLGIGSPTPHTDRKKQRILISGYVELLFAQRSEECGDLALAWLMMLCDPRRPSSFHAVMPQLTWALEKRAVVTDTGLLDLLHAKLAVWWSAAKGRFEDSDQSIFRIADMETAGHEYHSAPVAEFNDQPSLLPLKESPPAGPTVIVMRKDRCEEKGLSAGLEGPARPGAAARDLPGRRGGARAAGGISACVARGRDADAGPAIRRAGESKIDHPVVATRHRQDAPDPKDGRGHLTGNVSLSLRRSVCVRRHVRGTPKGWSTAQASVPARAIMTVAHGQPDFAR